MSRLLDPLTPDQQKLIDLIAEGYIVRNDGGWPIFDYLEGRFDAEGIDAWETLYSLPRVGRWNYSLVWWDRINQPDFKPQPASEIKLTIVGMHHSEVLRSAVPAFLDTLAQMAQMRRTGALDLRQPRDRAYKVGIMMAEGRRFPLEPETQALIAAAASHEPPLFASSPSRDSDGIWTLQVPRRVLDYEAAGTVEAYAERVEALTAAPVAAPEPVLPSPLALVAALDFLDTTWRLRVKDKPLFDFPSAERAAKLSHRAATADEFDSKLTALGEILRSARDAPKSIASRKLAAASFDHPLAPLRDYLLERFPEEAGRVGTALDDLEAAIAIRDAAQHTEATARAMGGLATLGLDHPVGDYGRAWDVISVRVAAAADQLREVVAAAS